MAITQFQRWALFSGLLLATIILARMYFDVSKSSAILAVPVWMLLAGALYLVGANAMVSAKMVVKLPAWKRVAMALVVPMALVCDALGCMGLRLWEPSCSQTCTVLIHVGIPIIFVLAVVVMRWPSKELVLALTLAMFPFLIPNCACYNMVNGWWIDRWGLSPACFGMGFTAGLVALSCLATGRRFWFSLATSWSTIVGIFGFFVGHHYFHFPW